MSDWQVGDLVVCVDASPCRVHVISPITSLRLGATYRVTSFDDGYTLVDGEQPHVVPGYLNRGGWDPKRFRRPDKHEACETEFVTLLKRSRQRVSA